MFLFVGQQSQAQSSGPEYNKAWGECVFFIYIYFYIYI